MSIAIVGDPHLQATCPRSRVDTDYLGTQLDEILSICEVEEHVVFLGDFLNRPSLPTDAELRVLEFLLERKRNGNSIYTIIGNHDIYNMSMGRGFDESKLAIFEAAGAITVLRPGECYGIYGLRVWNAGMVRPIELPSVFEEEADIVLAHYYFDKTIDPEMTITPEMLESRPPAFWFCGHDHEPYDPVKLINGTQVHRPGSLARDAAWPYNRNRIPEYCVIEDGEVIYKEVPRCRPSKELFREGVFEKLPDMNDTGDILSQLDSLMERLILGARHKDVTILGALRELECPLMEYEYLEDKLKSA